MIRFLTILLLLAVPAFGQFAVLPTSDSIGVDTNGDGTIDGYAFPATLKAGANMTFTLNGDILTIAGSAGTGAADSVGVDTNGDGTIDSYAYSSSGAAFVLKKGANVGLAVSGDTITISSTGGVTEVPVSDSTAGDVNLSGANISGALAAKADTIAMNKIADDTTNWIAAYGWGNHAGAGYLTDKGDKADTSITITGTGGLTGGGNLQGDREISIAADGVDSTKIAPNSVLKSEIAADAVDSNKVATGALGLSDIATEGATTGQVLKYDGATWNPGTDNSAASGDKADTAIQIATTAPLTGGGNLQANRTISISPQGIDKTQIDTTNNNIPFDGAFEGTTAVAESSYATKGYVTRSDSAKADTSDLLTIAMLKDTAEVVARLAVNDTAAVLRPLITNKTNDSLGVDVDGGAFDYYLYPAFLREGANITFGVTGDTLTITGSAGGAGDDVQADTGGATVDLATAIFTPGPRMQIDVAGNVVTLLPDSAAFYSLTELIDSLQANGVSSADSVGIDTSFGGSNGPSFYLYPAHIREGANVTFSNSGDTLIITASAAGENVAVSDSTAGDVDTSGTQIRAGLNTRALTGHNHNASYFGLADFDGVYLDTTAGGALTINADSIITAGEFAKVTDDTTAWNDDDDIPDAGDYSNLTAGNGLSHNPTGTLLVNLNGIKGLEFADDSLGIMLNGTSLSLAAGGLSITDEYAQDLIGAMVTGNTETNITVTYQDADGTIDFEVTGGGTPVRADTNGTAAGGYRTLTPSAVFRNGAYTTLSNVGDTAAVVDVDTSKFYDKDALLDTVDVYNFNHNDFDNATIDTSAGGDLQVKAGGIDSTEAADNGLSLDDIGWRFEWLYLTMIHGTDVVNEDSVTLTFPIHNNAASWLLADSAGNITAGDRDTFFVSGFVPFDCTIDSLQFFYRNSGDSGIVNIGLYGPDISTFTNLTDSSYQSTWAQYSSSSWATAMPALHPDITAAAGYRYAVRFITDFRADNNALHLGWVRIRVRR